MHLQAVFLLITYSFGSWKNRDVCFYKFGRNDSYSKFLKYRILEKNYSSSLIKNDSYLIRLAISKNFTDLQNQ